MINKYFFNAPAHEQFLERSGAIRFGGQEFDLDSTEALDPRLELVGEGDEAEVEESDETPAAPSSSTAASSSAISVPSSASHQGSKS